MINKILVSLKKPHPFRRIWRLILSYWFTEQWIIMSAHALANQEIPKWEDFHPILPPPDREWADPFPWFHDGRFYLFVEEKLYSTNIGRIICLSLDANMNITSSQVVLEKPYHLSYPFLFEYEEQLYMVPESNQNHAIELYKCLIPGIKAVDSTLLEKDGKWWLFANVLKNGGLSWDTLHLYVADHPLSDHWVPHPKNPIVKDIHTARPAGRFLSNNEWLIRPSQDCSVRYGKCCCRTHLE